MVVDSAPTAPEQTPGAEFLHERVLNDGSRHQVLKILHTPETMQQALAPLGSIAESWSTGQFFTATIVKT